MKNKVFVILAIGAISYLAIVGLVLMLYQADPADLKWRNAKLITHVKSVNSI